MTNQQRVIPLEALNGCVVSCSRYQDCILDPEVNYEGQVLSSSSWITIPSYLAWLVGTQLPLTITISSGMVIAAGYLADQSFDYTNSNPCHVRILKRPVWFTRDLQLPISSIHPSLPPSAGLGEVIDALQS